MTNAILKRFDLSGKTAAVTGGGGDLCGYMAEVLGAMGVKVAVLDIRLEKAKASVSNFTRWLAVHLARTGVRVNALAPGFFMTEQLRFLHVDRKTGELLPRARKVIAHTPIGRYGEPDHLIGTLVWLLSDASSFVTGVVVPIDGGFSSYSI